MLIYLDIIMIIFVLVSIYLFIKYNSIGKIEHYDDRLTNISLTDCAEHCKTIENCNGFGYDPFKNICYPSQLIISGRPFEATFRDDYLYTNITCNKPFPIVSGSNDKTPSFVERRDNSLYVCRGSFNLHPQYYFFNDGEFNNIGEGKNLDEIWNVNVYKVRPFNWPRNRFNCNQKDLLIKEIETNTFNNKRNITDLNRIVAYQNSQ